MWEQAMHMPPFSLSRALKTGVAALVLGAFASSAALGNEAPRLLPAPLVDAPAGEGIETAVLAGGCFWGIEGVFQHVRGVRSVISGYSGGEAATATYDQVTTEGTGHAEAVEIKFDPKIVSYGKLLRIFFSAGHDPTELNRQGPDTGPSYRSNIFYASADQQRVANAYIAQLNVAQAFPKPIVTRVDPLQAFYPAEAYHQDFLVRHPTYPYIVINDLPKVAALKRLFPGDYVETPVTGEGM
jgi:peptide-methionine (S)-S-oxide reductase